MKHFPDLRLNLKILENLGFLHPPYIGDEFSLISTISRADQLPASDHPDSVPKNHTALCGTPYLHAGASVWANET